MNRTGANQKGFTLLEVLIALALMALLSIISWRALDLVERSSSRLNASADDTLALVRVLGQIGSDVSRYAGADILPSPAAASVESGNADPIPDTNSMLPPGIAWTEPVLVVTRSTHGGAWQQVAWGKVGDTLRRAAGPPSHTLPLPDVGIGEVVLEQVKNFSLRAWIPGQGWSALNASGPQVAATGLEIVIEREHNGVDEAYRKVVLLP